MASTVHAMENFSQYLFDHKELGGIIGLARGDDVVQFRGIPFAAIPARFRQAQLLESLPRQPFDARHPGPYCPQALLPFPTYWDGEPRADYPPLKFPPQDELGCLTLNISVPRDALEKRSTSNLPVLFFIHGGAFVGGSQSIQIGGREIYDGTYLVRAAIAQNKPIVVVSCNYRVGPLGFLASAELSAYNKAHNEPAGNYGLHDQRQALEWCSKFISGFGGDSSNITIQGTSAGGASAHCQTIFPERKFKRAILASGTMIGIGPMPLEYHQRIFDARVARHNKAGSKITGDALVKLLQTVPVDEMVQPITDSIYHPLIDGRWIPGRTMESISHIDLENGAPDLMVGACDFEADLTQLLLMNPADPKKPASDATIMDKVFDICSSNGMIVEPQTFPSSHADVAQAYNLNPSLENPSSTSKQLADLLADVAFRIPPLHIGQSSRAAGSNVLVYNMLCSNPYPLWKLAFGRANHAINDLFVFDVAPDQVPSDLRARHCASVAQVRAAWLDFCYGELPWPPVCKGTNGLGPIFSFEDGERGRLADTLEEAVGGELGGRWRTVLAANGWEA